MKTGTMTDLDTLREMFARAGLYTEESDQGEALLLDVIEDENQVVFWFTYEGKLTKVMGYGQG